MGKEIYNIINDMAEVLNASQMQKLQEVLINRLSENNTVDYLLLNSTQSKKIFTRTNEGLKSEVFYG